MSPTTTSLQRRMSSIPRSPEASSGSLKTSTKMTSPSVRRSFMRAEDEPTLKKKACLPVCRFISHESCQEIERRNSESEQIRTLLDRKREQILADCQAEIRKHEFQADYDLRSIQKLKRSSRRKKKFIVLKQTNDADKIINFFMNSY